MLWMFLIEALVFAVLIPLIIRSRRKTAKEGELELEREAVEEGLDGEEVRNLLSRLSNFILNWDGELERMDKRAAALLIEQKARIKEGHDLQLRIEAETHQLKGEQRQREEHSQKEVAKSILGMVVREKSPTELLDWAHPTSGVYSRSTAPIPTPDHFAAQSQDNSSARRPRSEAEGAVPGVKRSGAGPSPDDASGKPTVAHSGRPSGGTASNPAMAPPAKRATPVRAWRPDKVFAS